MFEPGKYVLATAPTASNPEFTAVFNKSFPLDFNSLSALFLASFNNFLPWLLALFLASFNNLLPCLLAVVLIVLPNV